MRSNLSEAQLCRPTSLSVGLTSCLTPHAATRAALQGEDCKRAGTKLALGRSLLHQQEANVDIIVMVASSEDNFTVIELNCFSDLINLVPLGYGLFKMHIVF